MPPQQVYARPDEWEPHRETITKLWESMPLKEVMAAMKSQHNFIATEKMYKDRINKKWKLSKNLRRDDVAVVLRQKASRDVVGKQTAILLRGATVDHAKLQRHLRRNPGLLAGAPPDARSVLDLICRTPSPDLPPPPVIPRLGPEADVERLFVTTGNYYHGVALEDQLRCEDWTLHMTTSPLGVHAHLHEPPVVDRRLLIDIIPLFLLAFFEVSDDTFPTLNCAFDSLADSIKTEHPALLYVLLWCGRRLVGRGYHALVRILYKHVDDMVSILLRGQSQALAVIWRLLSSNSVLDRSEILERMEQLAWLELRRIVDSLSLASPAGVCNRHEGYEATGARVPPNSIWVERWRRESHKGPMEFFLASSDT